MACDSQELGGMVGVIRYGNVCTGRMEVLKMASGRLIKQQQLCY